MTWALLLVQVRLWLGGWDGFRAGWLLEEGPQQGCLQRSALPRLPLPVLQHAWVLRPATFFGVDLM